MPKIEPLRENVFRLDSDSVLNERIQKDKVIRDVPVPSVTVLVPPGTEYTPKTSTYEPKKILIEPSYVVHRRLYFERMNAERAGWDLGAVQPIVSAAGFVHDVVFWPHNVASGFWKNRWETSAGKCPPGAPTPLYLYPRGYTVSGMLWQAPLVTGLVFIFP